MEQEVLEQEPLFRDRKDAGKKLASLIQTIYSFRRNEEIVLGIPRGGIAVGHPVAKALACPMEPVTVRKLPLPWNDQMGFGAVTLDKEVLLNETLFRQGLVSEGDISAVVEEVYRELLRRDALYRGRRPFPELTGKTVFVIDDGLATGATMRAALRYARSKGARETVAAVPVAHEEAFKLIKMEATAVVCLYVESGPSFAVASYYGEFPDLSDEEVIALLKRGGTVHEKRSSPLRKN